MFWKNLREERKFTDCFGDLESTLTIVVRFLYLGHF